MRDLSAHEKHETQKLQKDLEDKKNENTELRKLSDKYQAKISELENTIAELHEQVRIFSQLQGMSESNDKWLNSWFF